MCFKGIEQLEESLIDCDQLQHQAVFVAMDSSNTVNLGSEEPPRMKFLCSFGGSILPRPQDGKLRYVGGETRIVSVPRDIGYEELMSRMRDLYEAAAILKYQQPDEDLDALVSVVNDDDVINMMEEYDKLGSGDGFTRLRIFLFSHPDQDLSPHYMDGDERDTERRYVDALNSLNESPDYRRSQFNDYPIFTPVDEVHMADQFLNSMNLEGSVHSQRNYEMAMPQYNLRQLAIPGMGSGQNSAPFTQWYNEESPFSPAYFSPRCAGPHEMRTFTEFPSSPSSGHYRVPFQEIPDKCLDRMPEETNHPQVNSQIPADHPWKYSDKVVWLPAGGVPVDRGGFPGNILNVPNVLDGTSVCEHCKMTFHKNPSLSDFHWKPEEQSHVEQSAIRNGFPQVISRCAECLPNREAVLLGTDTKLLHGLYNKEQGDRPLYNDTQTSERGWTLQNQLQNDEPRAHISGVGRIGNQYTLDGTGATVPLGGSNLPDGSFVPTTCTHIEDPRHIRAGAEWGGEIFHGQAVATGSHVHIPLEERGVRAANLPFYHGADIPHQVLHGHSSAQAMWRNASTSVQVSPPYESSNLQPRIDIPSGVVPRAPVESSPTFFIGVDQSPWAESSHRRLGVDGTSAPEHPYCQFSKLNHGAPFQEIQPTFAQDPVRNQHNLLNIPPLPPESLRPSELPLNNVLSSSAIGYSPVPGADTAVRLDERGIHGEASESTHLRKVEPLDVDVVHPPQQNINTEKNMSATSLNPIDSESIRSANGFKDATQLEETNTCPPKENADLTFLTELIASAKKAKLESAEVVKARVQEDGDAGILQGKSAKIAGSDETEPPDVNGNSEGRSQDEYSDSSKIEPTKAEEEAIARGLQTIRNDDLEEVRELGSGTYGAVYHGKWKGSDVAIKRIKASCFAGRPSERERLIADFWKEALILSSLHHPNVVSFYGIVRDGPDGSLATVTEFMVNGSLKQYLRKKDRTIDRRKRLIIAMDAAFGMEYLHGKNIVHFDLKCENLLVNMRDPHRPVCKIGDLGLSKVKQHTLVSGGVRGTLPWMAPELLSGKSNMVTEKIDVYSFGIVMWELLTGEEPYSDRHCASIIGGIVNNTLRPQIPTWCDPEWKSLMESCWASDPAERPSFSEISQKLRSMAAAMNVK